MLDKSVGLVYNKLVNFDAPLAQLDRVLGYEPRGQGFESLVARHGHSPVSPLVTFQ